MNNKEVLKKKLEEYNLSGWKIPEHEDVYILINEMIKYIGNIDPYLRDNLIYEGLFSLIYRQRKLSNEQLKELIKKMISDEFLFYGINEISDKMYTRTFTILNLVGLIAVAIEDNVLSKIDLLHVCDRITEYMILEKDYRDYDSIKGWGHSVAHTADLISVIVDSDKIDKEHVIKILDQIKNKATNNEHGFIYNEDERQINAFESIYKRKLLSDEEIISWIREFDDYNKEEIFPNRFIENTNRKNFLRCLYFRFVNCNYKKNFSDEVMVILNNMKKLY